MPASAALHTRQFRVTERATVKLGRTNFFSTTCAATGVHHRRCNCRSNYGTSTLNRITVAKLISRVGDQRRWSRTRTTDAACPEFAHSTHEKLKFGFLKAVATAFKVWLFRACIRLMLVPAGCVHIWHVALHATQLKPTGISRKNGIRLNLLRYSSTLVMHPVCTAISRYAVIPPTITCIDVSSFVLLVPGSTFFRVPRTAAGRKGTTAVPVHISYGCICICQDLIV